MTSARRLRYFSALGKRLALLSGPLRDALARGFRRRPFTLLSLTLLLILGGCTPHFRWQGLRDQLESLRQTRTTFDQPAPYRDFAGAIHVHSILSHDSQGMIDEIVEASRQAGNAFVIMTDHHKPKVYSQGFEGLYDEILVIRGSEIIKGCQGRTGETCNSILVLGVKEYINTKNLSMEQVIEEVRRKGGLAFVAHAQGFLNWDSNITGMEIYDILDDAVDRRWKFPKYLFDALYSFRRYPEEVFLSILDRPVWALAKWDELTQKKRIVAIAGNDAHQNIRVAGRQIDPYGLTLLFVRTHILAPSLTEQEVLSALAAGHAYLSFDILADATGFGFWAESDRHLGIMGDQVEWTKDLKLKVQTPLVGTIEVIKNGKPVKTVTAQKLTLPIEEAGVYRVEVSLPVRSGWWPWIYSNPIYVRKQNTVK